MQDGARNALIGYLYQMLGVSALRAIAASSNLHDLTLDWVGNLNKAHWIHEAYGQDAAVELSGGTFVAFQFKHAWDPTQAIELQQFREIIDAFDKSARELPAGGSFEHYVILTNRQLSESARAIYDARAGPCVPAGLMPHKNSTIRKAANARHGGPAPCEAAWNGILRRLLICPRIPTVEWEQKLLSYAASLGVRPEELRPAIHGLIGELIVETTRGQVVEVSEAFLKRHLVQAADARP